VDVLEGIVGTEQLGQLDTFVQHHTVWHVDAMDQLEGTDTQDHFLHLRQFNDLAIQRRLQRFVQFRDMRRHAVQQFVEILAINFLHIVVATELHLDIGQVIARQLPLVQRLQCKTARLATRRRRALVNGIVHQSCLNRLTISMAVMAASAPLFPALVPERSIACSMVSTVSTPKVTGMPVLFCTLAIPLAASPATYLKCAVPPRITAPRVMMASTPPLSARRLAATGSSQAPGTRYTWMSLALTPWRTSASIAPSSRASTTKLLKRATTMA